LAQDYRTWSSRSRRRVSTRSSIVTENKPATVYLLEISTHNNSKIVASNDVHDAQAMYHQELLANQYRGHVFTDSPNGGGWYLNGCLS
jgi:hypothetical protein